LSYTNYGFYRHQIFFVNQGFFPKPANTLDKMRISF
jgi:hypothetical protein